MTAAERSVTGGSRDAGRGEREAAPHRSSDTRPALLVAGRGIVWDDVRGVLGEAAGGVVVEEAVLDTLLAERMKRNGFELDEAAVEQEERFLSDSIARDAGSDRQEAARLIEAVRRSRGLGPERFDSLLRRNAMLRRLIRDEVRLSDADIEQAYAIRYGPRFRVRLLVAPTHADAAAAQARVTGRGGHPPEPFFKVASEVSTDPSRVMGGALEPISPADPTYPLVLRRVLQTLPVGEVSPVIALETGFAVLLMEEHIPASGVRFEGVSDSLREDVRLLRERVLMDRLAAQLLETSDVTVFDPGMDWSWRARRERATP